MKLYLVRHGQCESNVKKLYNYKNEDLTLEGIKQANELIKKIENIKYDIIYSSPLLRAKHTAKIINIKKKNIIFDNRLEERKLGSLVGKPLDIVERETYWNYYSSIKYGTEENVSSLYERVSEFLNELKDKDYSNVIIVAHNGVARMFNIYFNGIPKSGNLLNLGLKNTEVKEYDL